MNYIRTVNKNKVRKRVKVIPDFVGLKTPQKQGRMYAVGIIFNLLRSKRCVTAYIIIYHDAHAHISHNVNINPYIL